METKQPVCDSRGNAGPVMVRSDDREVQRAIVAKFRPICAAFPEVTKIDFFRLLDVARQGPKGINWENWQTGLGARGVSVPLLTETERAWSWGASDDRNETVFRQAKRQAGEV